MTTHCKRGHERLTNSMPSGGCLACHRFRRSGQPESSFFCRRGHLRTPENVTPGRTCKECMTERDQISEQKVKHHRNIKKYYLKKLYGMSPADWDAMFRSQKGLCAICQKHQSERKKTFNVDHDHKTGKVRALLCAPCNVVLGLVNDNPQILESAITYLKEHTRG